MKLELMVILDSGFNDIDPSWNSSK